MASNFLKPLPAQTQPRKPHPPPPPLPSSKALFSSHAIAHPTRHLLFIIAKPLLCSRINLSLSQTQQKTASSSSSDGFSPPITREEAVLQAKTCLSSTLQKPLNNAVLLPTKKVKRQKQPRFRVEIPVVDDSPSSLALLASDVFSDLPIMRKGAKPSILILWQLRTGGTGTASFRRRSGIARICRIKLGAGSCRSWNVEFLRLGRLHGAGDFTAGSDEEGLGAFAGSFEVVYSFVGLEVRGVLSRRKGMVFRWVKDGVFGGEGWVVLMEDETKKAELKVVTKFRKRPSIGEVENVLYNLMAANSPVTRSGNQSVRRYSPSIKANMSAQNGKFSPGDNVSGNPLILEAVKEGRKFKEEKVRSWQNCLLKKYHAIVGVGRAVLESQIHWR